MNRFWAITLTLCLVFGLVACAKPAPQNPTTVPTTTPTTAPTTAPTTPTTAPTVPVTFPTTPPNTQIDLSAIWETDYSDGYVDLNHKNVLSTAAQTVAANDVEKERQITLNGAVLNLTYERSIYYPLGSEVGHLYSVNGDANDQILLDNQGNLKMILYAYTKLNISPKASPDEVLEPLKAELGKIIDLSAYEVRLPTPFYYDDGSFTNYDFSFYHFEDGYLTEYFSVAVTNDGSVFGLKKRKLSTIDFTIGIDEEKAKTLLEAKLTDVYNTNYSRYLSHSFTFNPHIVLCNNQLYVRYNVRVTFLHPEFGEIEDLCINHILIPLDTIISTGQ